MFCTFTCVHDCRMYISAVYLTITESREEKTRRCGAVQFRGCSRSLCRAAGCAYLLLWSVEHEELKMSWKGANPFSPSLHRPHLLTHPSHLRPCASLSPSRALAPNMRLTRLSSCRGSAVVCVGLEGCLSKRGRKSRGMAKVWGHNKSLGKQLQGSEHHGFYISGKVSS